MGINELLELWFDGFGRILDLGGNSVEAKSLGKPRLVFWYEPRTSKRSSKEVLYDKEKQNFKRAYDRSHSIPEGTDSFIKGEISTFEDKEQILYILPVQLYQTIKIPESSETIRQTQTNQKL